MKNNSFLNLKYKGIIAFSFLLLSAVFFTSCDKNEEKGTPYFTIEGNPTGLTLDINGNEKGQSYVVRSNRPWKIEAQSDVDWAKVFPAEGDGDGIFKIIVNKNEGYESRVVNYAFVVDGEEQPTLFRVEEAGIIPYITITEAENGVKLVGDGGNGEINISSNLTWDYSLSDASWLTIQSVTPSKITFSAGLNIGNERSAVLTLTGKEVPSITATVTITQSENIPYIIASESQNGVFVSGDGGSCDINIQSNVNWNYSLSDASWLTEQSHTSTKISLSAGENTSTSPRSTVMTLTAVDYPSVTATVTISQGLVIMREDFSWLAYGASNVFYSTTDAVRYDAWTTAEKAHGWSSTPNPYSSNQPLLYASSGIVKVGKTTYGGDLVSPKLASIQGTKNIMVFFKAVPYETATGTKDDNYLNISAMNAGTPSVNQFVIDNWPVYPTDAAAITSYCDAFWNNPEATRSFKISDATSETQIKFLGGDYNLSGVGKGKNRIFLDDIRVELLP